MPEKQVFTEQAKKKILTELYRLWCDQHGLVLERIEIVIKAEPGGNDGT